MATEAYSPHRRWLVPLASRHRATLQMLCFPYGGGGPGVFRDWPGRLPALADMYAVQLPGRGIRLCEPPLTRLTDAGDEIADALVALRQINGDERPLVLFGHSLGALLAFEVARALRRKSCARIASLLCSGSRAPQLPLTRPPVHVLSGTALLQKLKDLNGTPHEILRDTELMRMLLPALRSDFEMAETYVCRAERPLDCPLTLFGGTNDEEVGEDELAAWQHQTSIPLEMHMLVGDHFFLNSMSGPLLAIVSQKLNEIA